MSKSQIGQTNKYSGVKNAVQNPQQKEEPNISPEQVEMAFQSFGIPMNDRNMNDLGYWTGKKVSEGPKLIEELHKRRMEINAKEDETIKTQEALHKSKETLSRLSDEEIDALFDEYGLENPSPEWVRSHLPNDPKKIRAILEVQRKAVDDLLKKQTKNMVNSTPEVPKMSQQQTQSMPKPMVSQNMGQGGPGLMQDGSGMNPSPASPFFMGDNSIVRITQPNNPNMSTLWLVDQKRKILRPFESEEALQNAFEDPEAAERSVVTLSTKDLGQGGVLEGFKMLNSSQGVKGDGSMEDIQFSPAQIAKRYGKPSDPAGENRALSILDGLFSNLSKGQKQTKEQVI